MDVYVGWLLCEKLTMYDSFKTNKISYGIFFFNSKITALQYCVGFCPYNNVNQPQAKITSDDSFLLRSFTFFS